MSDKLCLTLGLPPLGNRYWRMARNRIYMTREARDYKRAVAGIGMAKRIQPLTGEVAVLIRVYRARKAGDADGFGKVLLDSLEGVCYENDRQIVDYHVKRFDDRDNPRVEIEVWQVEEEEI